jgi:hypothetical protein
MAITSEEQKKINALIQEGIELAKKLGSAADEASLRNFTGDLVQAERLVNSLKKDWQDLTGDIGYAFQGFKNIVSEIKKQNVGLLESVKGYNNLASIAQKIQNHQRGISSLSSDEIKKLRQKAQEEKLRLENARDLLASREKDLIQERAILAQKLRAGTISENERKTLRKIFNDLKETRDAQSNINGLLQEQDELYRGLEKTLDRTEEQVKNIEKALGLGGNAAKGLEKTLSSLGLGDFARSLGLDEVNKKMDETAKKLTDNGDKAATLGTKFRVLGAGMKEMGKQLMDNLFDPMVILGMILKGFLALDKAQTEFTRETGRSADLMDRANTSATTMAQQIGQMTELTKQFGAAADVIFTPETITEATEMTKMMGLSSEEAGKLARLSKVTGTELKANNEKIIASYNNFVKLNKTGISAKSVFKDVANVSNTIALSFKGNTVAIAKSVMEARKLGLSLEQVDKIAESLLNFEDSIAAELEAELLTGKQINLEQARSYALANDMDNLTKEIGNNQEIINAFANGYRVEQEAIGKSLGLSREEMAKMIFDQQTLKGLSEEQAAKMAGLELSDMKRLEIQEQINNAIAKMSEALAGPLSAFAELLSNAWVLKSIFAAIGVILAAKIVTSLADLGRALVPIIARLATMLGIETGIAAAKISGAMATTIGLGAVAIIGGIAAGIGALTSSVNAAKQTKDGIINPNGGLVISKPEGGVLTPIAQGIPGDYAYLTTNGPQQTQDAVISPANKGAVSSPSPAAPQTITIHTHVMLDKKEIASAINQTNLQTEVKTQ